jgi:hypothetical protein
MQAIRCTRPGGHIGFVGVSHGVQVPGLELFFAEVHLHGGPAPVRRYLPELIKLIWNGTINPGKVFDVTLRSQRSLRVTGRWTSAERSRCYCDRERVGRTHSGHVRVNSAASRTQNSLRHSRRRFPCISLAAGTDRVVV